MSSQYAYTPLEALDGEEALSQQTQAASILNNLERTRKAAAHRILKRAGPNDAVGKSIHPGYRTEEVYQRQLERNQRRYKEQREKAKIDPQGPEAARWQQRRQMKKEWRHNHKKVEVAAELRTNSDPAP